MELEDLKKAWKQEDQKQTKPINIMEFIHQKSTGPIAALKTAFRKQMMAVIALLTIVIATQAKNVGSLPSHLLFWTYIIFCLAMIGGLLLNYQITRKLDSMDENVKDNLEHYVTNISKRLQWQNIVARVIIVFFILLLEIIPLYQHVRMVATWHSLHPAIRFSSYAAYLVFQYFLSRAITKKKFGNHLDYLKSLLQELR